MIQDITLIGRLGRDPEERTTGAGKPMCKFSIACDFTRMVNGEFESETTWYSCIFFGEQGERYARSFVKGDLVYVKATRLTVDAYTSKKTGEPAASITAWGTYARMLKKQDAAQAQHSSDISLDTVEPVPF